MGRIIAFAIVTYVCLPSAAEAMASMPRESSARQPCTKERPITEKRRTPYRVIAQPTARNRRYILM